MTWTQHESWIPIDTAPRDGMVVELLIPYSREKFSEAECIDIGYWDAKAERMHWGDRKTDPDWRKLRVVQTGCFRFNGDDGAFDIQPSHWRPLQQYPMLYSLRQYASNSQLKEQK